MTRDLFVWGWQSPLFIYSGLDGVTRGTSSPMSFLKAHANDDHPLIRPWIAEILRDLRGPSPGLDPLRRHPLPRPTEVPRRALPPVAPQPARSPTAGDSGSRRVAMASSTPIGREIRRVTSGRAEPSVARRSRGSGRGGRP